MGHAGTEGKYYDEVVEFAGQIGMIPLKLHKEQPGYILNSLLVPFLNAGEALYANDVADPETIDLTWSLATGAPLGPFRILDIADLTVDGTMCTGGAVCIMMMLSGHNVWTAMLAATIAGMLAGLVTGIFHTFMGIPAILAGILTQLSLYSINLKSWEKLTKQLT